MLMLFRRIYPLSFVFDVASVVQFIRACLVLRFLPGTVRSSRPLSVGRHLRGFPPVVCYDRVACSDRVGQCSTELQNVKEKPRNTGKRFFFRSQQQTINSCSGFFFNRVPWLFPSALFQVLVIDPNE